jgi:hypothetical protein
VRLAGDIHTSVKRERNRLFEETGYEPGMVALIEEAWRFYLTHRDRIADEKWSGRIKVEATVSAEDMQQLREVATARGYKSLSTFIEMLLEREASRGSASLERLLPEEAELALFIVDEYRGGGEYKPVAEMCMNVIKRRKKGGRTI